MRLIRMSLIAALLAWSHGHSQNFFRSGALDYFNRGQYRTAIDSMMQWTRIYSSERGIAYFYIGEAYYNLGLEESDRSNAIQFFEEGYRYFDESTRETDLSTRDPDKVREAQFKRAMCLYRSSELNVDPLETMERALNEFSNIASVGIDSLRMLARYLAGEVGFRIATHKRVSMLLAHDNVGQSSQLAVEAIRALTQAESAFQEVRGDQDVSIHLRMCAAVWLENIKFEFAILYNSMQDRVFDSITSRDKRPTASETAAAFLYRVNFDAILGNLDGRTRPAFEPLLLYSKAAHALYTYLLTGNQGYRQSLNDAIDVIPSNFFRIEREFISATRDAVRWIEDEFLLQSDARSINPYASIVSRMPEAYYWQGWIQYILNEDASLESFSRFIRDTIAESADPWLAFLRADAQFRIFMIRFERDAANPAVLSVLKQDMDRFRSGIPGIQDRVQLLRQLVRIGLGESIWGDVLRGGTTSERLRDAFTLIRNMLIRATRVTGQERVPYLNYLDQLFQITSDRRTQATTFYRGLALFLRAEIQETAQAKRELYFSTGELLKNVRGAYQKEANYVQARSYFAAAKHEPNPNRRRDVYSTAEPYFVQLINDAKSLRSVYYLGEIFRNRGNGRAARACYEAVIRKTENNEEGAFWFNNATAALQTCSDMGDRSVLDGIRINDVVFPEVLLEEDGESISLERYANPDFVRHQHWEEAVDIYTVFGYQQKTIYPSVHRLIRSRLNRYTFQYLSARIQDRLIGVTSGLKLFVLSPDAVENNPVVRFNGVSIEPDLDGSYKKTSYSVSLPIHIQINGRFTYPYFSRHVFKHPGIEEKTVVLSQRLAFHRWSGQPVSGITAIQFIQRIDRNTVLKTTALPISRQTFLYRDFESDVALRDFSYIEHYDAYLAVHAEEDHLFLYRNDPLLSREGEFPLRFGSSDERLNSPEGIAVDSDNRIYIVDWGSHKVHVFEKDGTHIRTFGGFGQNSASNVGQGARFVFPTRIAISEDPSGVEVDDKRFYGDPQCFVSDRYGVHLISSEGTYWDTVISSQRHVDSVYGIAVSGFGAGALLYISDRLSGNIEVYAAKLKGTE